MWFPRIPRTVIIALVIMAVIVAYLYMTPAAEFADGAPEATISVEITEQGETDGYSADGLNVKPQSMLGDALSVAMPMTTYTADVPPLDPRVVYAISFEVTVTTMGSIPEDFQTTVTITGVNSKTSYPVNGITGALMFSRSQTSYISPSVLTMQTTYNIPYEFTNPGFMGVTGQSQVSGVQDAIRGEYVDGAVFTVTIVSRNAAGSYGMTTADVVISVGAGGDLYVEITDITTSTG